METSNKNFILDLFWMKKEMILTLEVGTSLKSCPVAHYPYFRFTTWDRLQISNRKLSWHPKLSPNEYANQWNFYLWTRFVLCGL